MNPELQRNLWLEASPFRLALIAGLVLLALAATSVAPRGLGTTSGVALALYWFFAVLWGTRSAALSVVAEIRERTWDSQKLSSIGPWEMVWGKLFGATAANWFGALLCLPFVLLPAALAMRFDAIGQRGGKAQATIVFVGAVLAILVLPVSWYMHVNGGDSRGGIVRMDYRSLYDQISADGPVKTVVSSWFWVGNLRLVDADLIVLDDEIPDFARFIREPAVLVLANGREPP